MKTTKEELLEDAAKHKAETAEKKAEVAKSEFNEKVDDVKIGAADLAEKAEEKWEDFKDKAEDAWEDTKDKAAELSHKAQAKKHEVKRELRDSES